MRFLIRLLITAAALGLLLWHLGPTEIAGQFAHIDWRFLMFVAVVLAVQFAIIVWRWKVITDDISGTGVSFWLLARSLGASNLYGQLLPASVGGDIIRAASLGARIGVRQATLSVITDRLSGLGVLAAMIAVSLPFVFARIGMTDAVVPTSLTLLGGVGALAFILGFYGLDAASRLLEKIPLAGRFAKAMLRPALSIRAIVLGIVIQLMSTFLIYLLGHAIRVPLQLVDCVLLVPPALLLAALPISISGWGVREGALAGVFALVGMPAADIVPVSILFGLTAPALGLTYGLVRPFLRDANGVKQGG